MPLRQAEEAPRRRRKQSVELDVRKSLPPPAAEIRKRKQTPFRGPPPAFWDNLSRLWLTHRALRECDRRARERNIHQQGKTGDLKIDSAPSLKRFARHGGPDLSDIRAHSRPTKVMSQSKGSNQSRKRQREWDDAEISAYESPSKSSKTVNSTVYDKAFEQKLIDYGVFPYGYEYGDEGPFMYPENWDQINARLGRRRPSLSLSRFSRESFRRFERANMRARTEDDVKGKVLPMIFGDTEIPGSCNVLFNNLAPLTDDTIANVKPDYYEGSRPADLKQRVRDNLGEYIVPSADMSRPCLPSFFVEVKGPDGSGQALKRQACYAGATGARAMHELRVYVNVARALDGNAYATIWTYDSSSGTLISYTVHPTASESAERTVDYRMMQLNAYALTGNPESFRQGVTAFRNARDWAQERRREIIDAANSVT